MEKYERIARIGSGGQGKILEVRNKATSAIYACKMICCRGTAEVNFALDEVKNAMRLNHPNVVDYHDFFVHKDRHGLLYVCLILELCSTTDFSVRIQAARDAGQPFTEATLWSLLSQITLALDFLHSNGVFHRDVKPSNVLFALNPSKPGTSSDIVKLADFGLTTHTGSGRESVVGTPDYYAPEVMLAQKYDSPVDIWGLGTTMLEAATLLDRGRLGSTVIQNEKACLQTIESDITRCGYSSEFNRLICSMLCLDPSVRPTSKAILELIATSSYYALLDGGIQAALARQRTLPPRLADITNTSRTNVPSLMHTKLEKPLRISRSLSMDRNPITPLLGPLGVSGSFTASPSMDRPEVPPPSVTPHRNATCNPSLSHNSSISAASAESGISIDQFCGGDDGLPADALHDAVATGNLHDLRSNVLRVLGSSDVSVHIVGKQQVNVAVGQPYHNTIRAAVQAASNGDVIVILPGLYSESVVLEGRILTIIGAGGPSSTVTVEGIGAPAFVAASCSGRLTRMRITQNGGSWRGRVCALEITGHSEKVTSGVLRVDLKI